MSMSTPTSTSSPLNDAESGVTIPLGALIGGVGGVCCLIASLIALILYVQRQKEPKEEKPDNEPADANEYCLF